MPACDLLIVFDIDGTLTASSDVHQFALLQAFQEFGLREVNTDWGSYRHFTDSWIFHANFERQFARPPRPEEFVRFEKLFDQCYQAAVAQESIAPIPGAWECLAELSSLGIPYCFATGSMRSGAEHKLLSCFSGVTTLPVLATASEALTREEIIKSAMQKAKELHQCERFQRIVSVGDGVWDARTVANMQLEFIGIATGERAEALKAEGAKHVMPGFQSATRGKRGNQANPLFL